jgi:hypothetical protein
MRPLWSHLNDPERAAFRAMVAFLGGRLEERETIDWALKLEPNDNVKRLALIELINNLHEQEIREPWASAWRLIEESWNSPSPTRDDTTDVYHVRRRLKAGDRSGSLVIAIVELVSPRLKVEPFSSLHLRYTPPPKRPKRVEDLFSTSLTSERIVDPAELKLRSLVDRSFLLSLVVALDATVARGLDLGRRIGWDGERRLWRLGDIYRVYYVPPSERAEGEHEPDDFHRGIAPSVKLLHAVVERLVEVDNGTVTEILSRWKLTNSPVYLRLWAALSRDSRVMPGREVGAFLLSLDDRRFWNINDYPEIAELRAKRFSAIDPDQQTAITGRIRKRPPRNHWPRKADANQVKNARRYLAVQELKRIELAGGTLPRQDKTWLDKQIPEFSDLAQMAQLSEGFLNSPQARWVQPDPDNRYDALTGEERLKSLEVALSTARTRWDADPSQRASDWIRKPGNPIQVLGDLESTPDAGSAFPKVWEQFGWSHSPLTKHGQDSSECDRDAESTRVLLLLVKLNTDTVRQSIDGISHWVSAWGEQVISSPDALAVWLKIWPIAVEATNTQQPVEEEALVDWPSNGSSDQSNVNDLDTLNTPAGKLVGVFLAMCQKSEVSHRQFDVDGTLRTMRDTIIVATGRSGLIAKFRMIEALPYFLQAASEWTQEHLIMPLIADNSRALTLWQAIARRTHSQNVLKIIGEQMTERATDRRLDRETRSSLVLSLIVECLFAFLGERDPAVQFVRVQQMLRSLDDEVRANGAETVQRFVRDISNSQKGGEVPQTPEHLFRSSAAPFLQRVWPQERSLATPGVSRALADLPATSREAFAEAVDIIERFLVPFDCWSMIDFGLYGEDNGISKLTLINNHAKAAAFLQLLDLTIGTAEGSVIPHDLADALDQIRSVDPTLAENRVFRRLATAARRV